MDYVRIRQRRKGSLSVLAPRRQTTMRLPQTKTRLTREPAPLGTSRPPPFWEKGGDSKFPEQPKEKNINKENLTWLGGRDHNDIPRCHQWPHPA